MKDVLIIFIILLVLLMLISSFGGSIRQQERFYNVPAVPTTSEMPPPITSIPDLPTPPPAIRQLLESEQIKVQSEGGAATMSNQSAPMGIDFQSAASTVEEVSTDLQSLMPPILTMGTPQNTMSSLTEKFENMHVEAFDADNTYASF